MTLVVAAAYVMSAQEEYIRREVAEHAAEYNIVIETFEFRSFGVQPTLAETYMLIDGSYHMRFSRCLKEINLRSRSQKAALDEIIDHEIAHALVWENNPLPWHPGYLYSEHGDPYLDQFQKVAGYRKPKRQYRSICN